MQFRFAKAALALAAAILMGSPSVWAQDRFEWDGVIAAGQTIEIKGVNGTIEADSTSGNVDGDVLSDLSRLAMEPRTVGIGDIVADNRHLLLAREKRASRC